MSKGKRTKNISVKMGSTEDFDKENISPMMKDKDTKASSSLDLAKVVSDAALTKLRQKKVRVPPLNIPSSTSIPLSPTADEFHLPPYVAAMPGTDLTSLLNTLCLTPPFSPHLPPPSVWPDQHQQLTGITAVVEQAGFTSFKLRYGVVVDLSANLAIRVKNVAKNSNMSLSACTTQMAMVHPKGRVLQYGPRVEVQSEDIISVKNAKIFPRGISFTANNLALVYLIDEAGARTTTDMFHDLHATEIADTLFEESCRKEGKDVFASMEQLDGARYWRTEAGVDCWVIGQVFIQQTEDGLVIVERELQGDKFVLKTSPSNGKLKFYSNFLQVTASLGDESHVFLRSMNRRLHYSGQSKVFTVRNAGHSAGFDEEGSLRIY